MERKKKIFAAAVAALVLAGGGAFVFLSRKYGGLGGAVAAALAETAAKRAGRELRIKSASFSPFTGLELTGVEVSEEPSFEKGVFFSAERVLLDMPLLPLLKGEAEFNKAEVDGAFFKLRERDGDWNYGDLLELLPDTAKGLHLTWNAREVVLRRTRIQADMATPGLSLDMTETEAAVKHYSSFGGNFDIKASGRIGTAWGGRLFTGDYSAEIDLNFTPRGLDSTSGGVEFEDLRLGDSTLGSLTAGWDFFKIGKPAERNFSLRLEAAGFLAPSYRKSPLAPVEKGIASFYRAMGAAPPRADDIKADSLALKASLKEGRLKIEELRIDSDMADLRGTFAAGGGADPELELEAEAAGKRFRARISGPEKRPKVEPELSNTLRQGLLSARRGLEEFFRKKLGI